MTTMKRFGALYAMMIPVVLYFLVYAYYPLARGLQISFQDYRLMGTHPYTGWDNYRLVLQDASFLDAFVNTLLIGGGTLALGFAAPLAIALSLNEVLRSWFRKTAQMVLYLPHLLSWVVIGGMWIFLLSPDTGLVNVVLVKLGMSGPIHFLADAGWSRWMLILLVTWKDMGYNCILFLAGIVSISPSLYEAARMDGASRWQQMRDVTLPQLSGTMKVIFLLNTLGILRIFDPVFILRNPATASKVDVLMMYTFQRGILEMKIGPAAAASFLVVLLTFALTFAVRRLIRFDEV